ncbi:Trimethyllysine dioxygenase [Jaminaea rosea]|uniref:trimethyllysine dioxygenase n=1 Tax=Jaminaea rosea TaxID=1569628 RepID=A0A316UPS7_9BASI|nr:Trimethyllysine dioxygenase [Jaminaea rosea]PWN27280.1 Trimethyllysine dioxygenase [Jaminaea rosea]
MALLRPPTRALRSLTRSGVPLSTTIPPARLPTIARSRSISIRSSLRQASPAPASEQHAHAHAQPPPPTSSSSSHASTSSSSSLPSITSTDTQVRITWISGIESRYHHVWLRDHCRCPSCYHPKTKQRLLDTFAIPPTVQPERVEATTEGLEVVWPLSAEGGEGSGPGEVAGTGAGTGAGQHVSLFPWKWLRTHSYAPVLSPSTTPYEREDLAGSDKTLWGSGIAAHPPTVQYEEVMSSDRGVWKWVEKISQYGFSFVDGVPATPEATEELIKRIAFIRETHYGGFWDFTSDLSHGDTAYTDLALGAHTDTTYFTDPAGLQMFHLLSHEPSSQGVQPSGGASLLVDGFLAAKVLRDVHPQAYETLSAVRISTHSAGDEATLVRPLLTAGYPILNHDPRTGKLVLVRYNNDDRSTLHLEEGEVEPFYDALRKWQEIITSKEGEYWEQLTPGRALIFDNHRVLHGRSAFVGERRLCGAYVNHDDYRSRLAVLRQKYGKGGVRGGDGGGAGEGRGVWDDAL